MKITATFIKQLVKALKACSITTYDMRIEESDEYIIRFENINDCTISLYFYHSYAADEHDGYQIGYYNDNAQINKDAQYKLYAYCNNLNDSTKETAIIEIALILKDMQNIAKE